MAAEPACMSCHAALQDGRCALSWLSASSRLTSAGRLHHISAQLSCMYRRLSNAASKVLTELFAPPGSYLAAKQMHAQRFSRAGVLIRNTTTYVAHPCLASHADNKEHFSTENGRWCAFCAEQVCFLHPSCMCKASATPCAKNTQSSRCLFLFLFLFCHDLG